MRGRCSRGHALHGVTLLCKIGFRPQLHLGQPCRPPTHPTQHTISAACTALLCRIVTAFHQIEQPSSNPHTQTQAQLTLAHLPAPHTTALPCRIMTAFHQMGLQPDELLTAVEQWANQRLRKLSPQVCVCAGAHWGWLWWRQAVCGGAECQPAPLAAKFEWAHQSWWKQARCLLQHAPCCVPACRPAVCLPAGLSAS